MTEPVVLQPYDPAWPATFAALAARVEAALRPLAPVIEHVGSTAVPGLAAKPVIDLDVLLPVEAHAAATARLATLGYVAQGEKGVPGRFAFGWPPGEPRHHLYLGAPDAPGIRDHLRLRDALRADPALRDAYAAAKAAAVVESGGDRDRYLQLKGEFIAATMARLAAVDADVLLPTVTAEFAVPLLADAADAPLSADEALAQLAAFDTLPLPAAAAPAREMFEPPPADPATGDLLALPLNLAPGAGPAAADPAALEHHLSALDDFELLDE